MAFILSRWTLCFHPKGQKKSSCRQTFRAVGCRTAAVREEQQAGTSLKMTSSALQPTVKIGVRSARLPTGEEARRSIRATNTDYRPPPTLACSITSRKPDNCCRQPEHTHSDSRPTGVCVQTSRRVWTNKNIYICSLNLISSETGRGSVRGAGSGLKVLRTVFKHLIWFIWRQKFHQMDSLLSKSQLCEKKYICTIFWDCNLGSFRRFTRLTENHKWALLLYFYTLSTYLPAKRAKVQQWIQ